MVLGLADGDEEQVAHAETEQAVVLTLWAFHGQRRFRCGEREAAETGRNREIERQAEEGGAATMVFDEIDRGVGGAVASAIGERLARLAERTQVLVVTHSPQVAARGRDHFFIAKSSDGTVTRTGVHALDEAERREEIARMLSGATITDEARAQAGRLLETA